MSTIKVPIGTSINIKYDSIKIDIHSGRVSFIRKKEEVGYIESGPLYRSDTLILTDLKGKLKMNLENKA